MSKRRSRKSLAAARLAAVSASVMVPAAGPDSTRKRRWISVGLIILSLAVYAPVWRYDFINLDDPPYVSENPHIAGGFTWRAVEWAWAAGYQGNWHPLTWMSHMLDIQLFGLHAGPHHAVNVMLHVLSTLLLFAVLHRMTGALGRSALVAALFAAHPLHVESVAWVAERKDVLSTMFWMLTLWSYAGYVRQPGRRRYAVVLLCFGLGLLSKPMLVTLPFVLLLMDYWPLQRAKPGADWKAWGRLAREKVPLLALAAASSVVAFVMQRRAGAVIGMQSLSAGQRVANALVSYLAYIGKMAWPDRLAIFYPYRAISAVEVLASVVVLAGVSVVCVRTARRFPYLPVGWCWYLGTLVPVIGLIQVGDQAMADRYTYVPLIGLFLMVVWGATDCLGRRVAGRLGTAAAVAVVALYGFAAHGQVLYWDRSATIWEHALDVTQGNYLAEDRMGTALDNQGETEAARAHFAEALRLNPNYVAAYNNLGHALMQEGRLYEATVPIGEALRRDPAWTWAHYNMGLALEREGKRGEAMAQFTEALRLDPDSPEAHNAVGLATAEQGRLDEAIPHFFDAIRLRPSFAEAHSNLANALALKGRVGEAIAQYSEALRLKPDYADAHNNMGMALEREGKANEAMAQFTEALRLNPESPVAHNEVGRAMAEQGHLDEAIAEFFDAVRLRPSFAEAHGNLANALALKGRVGEAIAHYSEALRLKPDYVEASNNLAAAYLDQRRTGDAVRQFNATLRMDPDNARARAQLEKLAAQSKKSGP